MTSHSRYPQVVLVVDDHADTRSMLKVMLELRGLAVIEAENGEVAIKLAASVRPDLILMDALLPLIDGLTTTRLIREQPALSEVPIIGITGLATVEFQAKAVRAGCNACLIKPIDFELFEELLDRFLIKTKRAVTFVPDPRYSLAIRSSGVMTCFAGE